VNPRAATARRFAGGRLPLVALALYGIADGDPSQGLEVSAAACWVDAGNGAVRFQDGIRTTAVDPLALVASGLEGVDGRRFTKLSLSPDQNSRRVIAWTENGVCTVSRIFANADRRDSFEGEDCVLFWDGWLLGADATGTATDVIAFYLSPDRLEVRYRLQVENYGVERVYGTLNEPCSLDAVARNGLNLALYLSPKGSRRETRALVSAPYPVRLGDGARIGVALQAGDYFEVIVLCDPTLETVGVGAALQSGNITETVVTRDAVLETVSVNVALHNGQNTETIIMRDGIEEACSLSSALQTGAYLEVIVSSDPLADAAILSSELRDGVYVDTVVTQGNPYADGVALGCALQGGAYVE
jgi:hypothetical protein